MGKDFVGLKESVADSVEVGEEVGKGVSCWGGGSGWGMGRAIGGNGGVGVGVGVGVVVLGKDWKGGIGEVEGFEGRKGGRRCHDAG